MRRREVNETDKRDGVDGLDEALPDCHDYIQLDMRTVIIFAQPIYFLLSVYIHMTCVC